METFLIYLMGYLLVVSTEYKSTTQLLAHIISSPSPILFGLIEEKNVQTSI